MERGKQEVPTVRGSTFALHPHEHDHRFATYVWARFALGNGAAVWHSDLCAPQRTLVQEINTIELTTTVAWINTTVEP